MYKRIKLPKTSIQIDNSFKGETIEQKVMRVVTNKEPIKDGAPIVYTERKDGVRPEYDIRTDRMEIAVEKMDYIARANEAKRENSIAERAKQGMKKEEPPVPPTPPVEGNQQS